MTGRTDNARLNSTMFEGYQVTCSPLRSNSGWEMMVGAWAVERRVRGGVAVAVDENSVVQSSGGISWLCCLACL